MKKSVKILLITVAAVIVLAMAATVSLSMMTFIKVSAMEQEQAQQPTEDNADDSDSVENNILIGGQYMIRSTRAISDAYLSGDSSALSSKDQETLAMASKVIGEVITEGMSDYEKEQAIFLWMNEHIGGDSSVTVLVRDDITTDNPHGVLSGNSAVCVGYATTFRLFMQMLDIPCMVVHDVYLTHSWDLVQIGGHWYHVDLYSAHGSHEPLSYLNRPDALQRYFGSEWDAASYPASDSYQDCYLYRQAVHADDLYAVPAALRDAIDDDRYLLSLLIPAGEHDDLLAEYVLSSLENQLMSSVEYQGYYFTRAAVRMDDGSLLVAIMVDRFDYEDPEEFDTLTYEEMERVDQAIWDSFGELTPNEEYYDYY